MSESITAQLYRALMIAVAVGLNGLAYEAATYHDRFVVIRWSLVAGCAVAIASFTAVLAWSSRHRRRICCGVGTVESLFVAVVSYRSSAENLPLLALAVIAFSLAVFLAIQLAIHHEEQPTRSVLS